MAPETQRVVDKMNAKHVSNPLLSSMAATGPVWLLSPGNVASLNQDVL